MKKGPKAYIFPVPVANLSIRHTKPAAADTAVDFVVHVLSVQKQSSSNGRGSMKNH